MKKDDVTGAEEIPGAPNEQRAQKINVVDNTSESGSTLLPMLIAGIVLIIVGMIAVFWFTAGPR